MYIDIFADAFSTFVNQLVAFLPKLIVAYLIWVVGKSVISWGLGMLDKVDIKGLKVDNKARGMVRMIAEPLAKVILFLIVLDTLGIGSSIISSLASGFTFSIAIALGLAFGKALEPEAKDIVAKARKQWKGK
jgi:hypothetical protein